MPAPKAHPSALRANIPPLLAATDAWIGHRSKKPLMLPHGRRSAKTNVSKTWRPFSEALDFYERTHADPFAGIGFVLQRSQGVVFIDFDHCLDDDGVLAAWAEPWLAPFRGKTFIERSLSGHGLHILALAGVDRAHPKLVPPGARDPEHIEVYNNLRFIAITGDAWDGAPATLAPMQDELEAMLVGLGVESLTPDDQSPAASELSKDQIAERVEEARSALTKIDPDITYEEWVRIGMALHHGLGDKGLELWDEWSSRGGKYKKGETAERWSSFRRSGVTMGSLFHAAKENGWTSPLDDPQRQFEPVDPEPEQALEDIPFSEGAFEEWVAGGYQLWKPNPKQEVLVPCFNEANLHRFFARHEDWGPRLRFNIRSQYPEIDGETIDDHRSYRALAQSHAFMGWTKRAYSMKVCQAVIQSVAETNAFDPIAEWIRAQTWDGTKRVETLTAALGIEDTTLTRRFLMRWLIGAVARALRPGCKMQNMLLLLGPQGRHKSSLLERLAVKPEWFHESHIELKNKEGYLTLDRKWIVEFAELDALRKVDIEKVKAFISESVSNYRSPYARASEDHPRHFVLAGTANEDRVLRDPTGARRFWPVRCPEKLDIRVLTPEYVSQLWAEARTMYDAGVRWWDDSSEVDEVNQHNDQFYAESAAEIEISRIVEEEFAPHGALRMKQLIQRLLEAKIIQASTPENAVGTVLRRAGWTSQQFRMDGQAMRFWFPPTVPVEDRKQAAVVVFSEWKRKAGSFEPVAEEKQRG